MKSFKTLALVGLIALGSALSCSDKASAAVFEFSFSSPSTTISFDGWLTATLNGSGNYDVTGISGSVTSSAVTSAITGLVPVTAPPPAYSTSPDGHFYFDNVIYTTSPLSFNLYGLLFKAANGNEYNWGSDGGINNALWTFNGPNLPFPSEARDGVGSITAVPEPSTWAMMICKRSFVPI